MLRTVFIVEIAVDEATKQYVAGVYAVAPNKTTVMVMPSLRLLFPRLKKALIQKDKEMRKFPLPEERLIVSPNGSGAPTMLVLPNGH